MPKLTKEDETPQGFRPYFFHGIELPDWKSGADNGYGDCVLCGGESKFSVNCKTSQFRCWKCGESGNAKDFLVRLWTLSEDATKDYRELASNRKLFNVDTPHHWGAAKSITTHDWLLPAYNASGNMIQVYRYLRWGDRMALLPTPTITPGHGIFGRQLYDADKPKIYLCEGPWDGMALWEILGQVKDTGRDYVSTGNDSASLRAEANVLAIPSCTVFFGSWLSLFSGKIVYLMLDNDYPRTHPDTGASIEPAGYKAVRRISEILSSAHQPPAEIHCLDWHIREGGYDPTLPDGTDVRDILCG